MRAWRRRSTRLARSLAEFGTLITAERRERAVAAATARDLRIPASGAFARFGPGSVIVPPGRVTHPELIEVGDDVVVLEHAFLSVVPAVEGVRPRLVLGDGCRIGRFAHIACVGEIVVGPDVLASERVFLGDTYHGYEDPGTPVLHQPMAYPARVEIGRGAFLGIGATVLMGVTVGEQAYVAAGAVVTTDVEPLTLVAGNPARPIRRWDPDTGTWARVSAG